MGCDIYLYVEYKEIGDTKYWYDFGGRINPGRNYALFGLMADGVRSSYPESFKPKGLPEDLGYASEQDSKLYIDEKPNSDNVTLLKALSWEKQGISKIIFNNGEPTWVTHPDWHSHSWLSADEFLKVIENYNKVLAGDSFFSEETEWEAINILLQHFKNKGYESRIVFWFDN